MVERVTPPLRSESPFDEFGQFTIRYHEYFEQTAKSVNSSAEASAQTSNKSALSRIFALENRLGSGDALTSDETGFTVDSDRLSVDMDEA